MTARDKKIENGVTRREALTSIGGIAAGVALVSSGVTTKALAAGETVDIKKAVNNLSTTTTAMEKKMKTSYKLDAIIKIDESLCINCDACIRCCPGGLIAEGKFPVPTADSWEFCIDCGHCVAICPTAALQQRAMGPEDCGSIDIQLIPTWDEARQFLVTKLSIRGYVNKPVEKEKILQLLDVARYAANGGNRQVLRWLVINDPAKVHQVAALTIDWMKSTKDTNPTLYHEAKLEVFINHWEAGRDQISRGAPCIIQAWAGKDERTAPPAAAIAITHIQLAATTLGLGTIWTEGIGFASRAYKPLLDVLGMPEGQIPFATFLIGYPTEFYHRIPARKPVDVTWV
jgi:nitroreductase/Pyruvate/2-oxoacid:ferredoxin oxidoreductase delta subunit